MFQPAASEHCQFAQRFEILLLYAGRGLDFYASDPATAVLQHDVNFMFSVVPKVIDIHLLLSPGRLLAQLHEYQVLQQPAVILASQYLAGITQSQQMAGKSCINKMQFGHLRGLAFGCVFNHAGTRLTINISSRISM